MLYSVYVGVTQCEKVQLFVMKFRGDSILINNLNLKSSSWLHCVKVVYLFFSQSKLSGLD